jgi:hypothetical protein
MTKMPLQSLKTITTWGGVAVTFSGIVLGVVNGGSRDGAYLSFFGLLITCCGHLITSALAKHQAAEQAADKERVERDRWRIDRRIDRIKYGAGAGGGHDVEDW